MVYKYRGVFLCMYTKQNNLNFFSQKIVKHIFFQFFFQVFKCTWKIRNRLNQKKNQIFIFKLWSFLCPYFRWIFHDNSKKNGKLIFHSFQHIAHHPLKPDQNLGGWEGLHTLSWEIHSSPIGGLWLFNNKFPLYFKG